MNGGPTPDAVEHHGQAVIGAEFRLSQRDEVIPSGPVNQRKEFQEVRAGLTEHGAVCRKKWLTR
jgi:hypothetical protein